VEKLGRSAVSYESLADIPASQRDVRCYSNGEQTLVRLNCPANSELVLGHGRRQMLWFEVTRHPMLNRLAEGFDISFDFRTNEPRNVFPRALRCTACEPLAASLRGQVENY
jgi:hypothetical protein